MKKYIVVLFALLSLHALLADPIPSQEGAIQLSSPMEQAPFSSRVITQDEFNGQAPIVMHLNELLVIPFHYQRFIIQQKTQIFFGPQDPSVVQVNADGVTWSDSGMVLDLNLICIGVHVGETKIKFGEDGQCIKELTIQIVE